MPCPSLVYVLSMCCLCVVYVLSMCCLCVAYVLSVLSLSCLCLVYVLSMSCLCLVYVLSMSCLGEQKTQPFAYNLKMVGIVSNLLQYLIIQFFKKFWCLFPNYLDMKKCHIFPLSQNFLTCLFSSICKRKLFFISRLLDYSKTRKQDATIFYGSGAKQNFFLCL